MLAREGRDQGIGTFRSNREQQAARRLRVYQEDARHGIHACGETHRFPQAVRVARRTAGDGTALCHVAGVRQERDGGRLQLRRRSTRKQQAVQVTQQPEPRHIRARMHAHREHGPRGASVEGRHRRHRWPELLFGQEIALQTGRQHARTDRLREHQGIAGPRPGVRDDARGMHFAHRHHAELRLRGNEQASLRAAGSRFDAPLGLLLGADLQGID